MSTLIRKTVMCALIASGCFATSAVAQTAAPQRPQANPPSKTAPDSKDPADKSGQPGGALADPLAEIGTVIPDTSLARTRMRDNLYALLATAEDEKIANKIAARIERLWRISGSETVTLLVARADKALSGKKAESAQKFLDAAVELAPDFAEGWNRRAYVNFERGDLRAAVGDLRRVLALDPNHYKALSGLATILKETGNDDAALKAYERLLDVHPFFKGAQKAYDALKLKVEGQRL